jgi:hypothetical protein
MPRFPETKNMTKEERLTSVTVYLSKVVDHLQGVPNEPIRRPHPHRSPGSQVSPDQQIQNVLSGAIKEVTSHQD